MHDLKVRKPLWASESGATSEYILILTLFLGVLLVAFWGRISSLIKDKVDDIDYGIVNMKKRPRSGATQEPNEPGSTPGGYPGTGSGSGSGSGSGGGIDGIPTTPSTPIFVSSETRRR